MLTGGFEGKDGIAMVLLPCLSSIPSIYFHYAFLDFYALPAPTNTHTHSELISFSLSLSFFLIPLTHPHMELWPPTYQQVARLILSISCGALPV